MADTQATRTAQSGRADPAGVTRMSRAGADVAAMQDPDAPFADMPPDPRPMRERVDELIIERAPWIYARRPGMRLVRELVFNLLSYHETLEIGDTVQQMTSPQLMGLIAERTLQDLQITGLHNLPRSGPALVVANHPTGIADGILMYHLIGRVRRDAFVFANKDIIRILPQMQQIIAPVEWRVEKRSHAKTRETMAYTRAAVDAGRIGVIFPAGRLSKRRGLSLHERPWMASAAMIARKFDLPVVPVHIQARNSLLFYLFDALHPTLRDITLFYEMLNKDRQPFRVTVGEPIAAAALPAKSEEGIEVLRRATLDLGGARAPAVSMIDASRRPAWLKA